jgi:hypothetical protein
MDPGYAAHKAPGSNVVAATSGPCWRQPAAGRRYQRVARERPRATDQSSGSTSGAGVLSRS